MVVPGLPVLFDGEAGNLERAGQHAQSGGAGQGFADVAGQGGDQVAGRENGRQAQKAGQLKPYLVREVL